MDNPFAFIEVTETCECCGEERKYVTILLFYWIGEWFSNVRKKIKRTHNM